jgi:hypothetical protein
MRRCRKLVYRREFKKDWLKCIVTIARANLKIYFRCYSTRVVITVYHLSFCCHVYTDDFFWPRAYRYSVATKFGEKEFYSLHTYTYWYVYCTTTKGILKARRRVNFINM